MKTGMAIVVGVVAAMQAGVGAARAQHRFFDTFGGSQLRSHWQQPPPEHWEYTVGGGQLTVTDLFHPGLPGELNTATIAAEFPEFTSINFELTAIMGWAPGEGRVLTVRLWGPGGLYTAFGYDESGLEPLLFLEVPDAFPPTVRTVPAPGPGTHEFRLVDNHADGLMLYVDGAYSVGFGFGSGDRLSRVEVAFAGAEGVGFSPLNVDLVSIVVPAPGNILALAGGIGITVVRRRRS